MGNNKSLSALINSKDLQKAEEKITKQETVSFDDFFRSSPKPVNVQARVCDEHRDLLKRLAQAKTMENKKENLVDNVVDIADILYNIMEGWKQDNREKINSLLRTLTEI